MKSLLSAALSRGGGSAAAPTDPTGGRLDASSFPCVAEGKDAAALEAATAGMQRMDFKKTSLPGSAPTATHLAGTFTADYELNPYSLRSGPEMVPTSLTEGKLASNFLSEAVIGSLPRGLSVKEREAVFANTPLSPTLNLVSSMPSDRVAARSMEGARLRRHLLRGAVVVFITAGYSGKRFIFEKAKELGVRSVIVDGPDSWSKELVAEGVIERFVGLDMSDAETVFERCLAAIQRVKKELGELDGVCSFSEMAMPLVARLAEKLGLPGTSPASVDAARDKHATRGRMEASGLPTPRNTLLESPADLEKAAAHVGFPAVIKPIYGAASIGVVRVDSLDALRTAYARVCRELASAKIVAGALTAGDEEGEDAGASGAASGDGAAAPEAPAAGSASSWIKTTIMMEEYLDGPEVDVDLVFSEGQPVYGAVTDNWPTVEPYFNETGSNAPSILPAYQQRELLELSGVFHVECKYTSRGPRLIEVNCRMGGGPVRNMNMLVWGVDMVEEALIATAGIPCRPPVAAKPLMNIAEFSVNAMSTGVLRDTGFLARWQGDPSVLYARTLVEPGSKVVCARDGLPTWICELMVTKPTIDEAIQFVKHMEAEIQQAMVIEPFA